MPSLAIADDGARRLRRGSGSPSRCRGRSARPCAARESPRPSRAPRRRRASRRSRARRPRGSGGPRRAASPARRTPYSRAYCRSTMGGGSLPFLRTGTNPLPRFSASAAARMKPRDSTPATASASDHSRSFHSASSAATASWKCERRSGVMSRNRMPGCGKSGTSTTNRASGCMEFVDPRGRVFHLLRGGARWTSPFQAPRVASEVCARMKSAISAIARSPSSEAADRREHVRHAVPDGRERTGALAA